MSYYLHSSSCSYFENFDNGVHTYCFTGPCIVTGEDFSVKVLGEELWKLNQGTGINALISNTLGEREFLKTGISPTGWDQLFPDQEGGEA